MNSNELVDKMETLAIKRGMQARIDKLGHALAKAQAERDEWHSAHSIRSDELDGAIGMLNEARARVAELEQDKARLDWLEDNGHLLHICCWHHSPAKENEWTIHKGDFDGEPIGADKLLRAAIDAAKGQP